MLRRLATLGVLTVIMIAIASPAVADQQKPVWQVFADAEHRFRPPADSWFYETQQTLREEAILLSDKLDLQGPEYAAAWKAHLHWPLLEKNLGAIPTVNVDELRTVRRWFYSNRTGLETNYFADIRQAIDQHLDAAIAFSHHDLQHTFVKQVQLARKLCQKLADNPTDANAADLGRVLGWFETTRQLPEETAAVRKAMSLPNAQMIVSHTLLQRVLETMTTDVEESVTISDQESLPSSGRRRRSRQIKIRGTAHTSGSVTLEVAPNDEIAEINLVYRGEVESICRGIVGPVTLHMHTFGTASAVKPIFFGLTGLATDQTQVTPNIKNTIDNVTSDRAMLRRIGERRANKPEAKAHKDMRARAKAVELLKTELDKRVDTALAEIKAEVAGSQKSLGQFSQITAPLYREGAAPSFHSTRSNSHGVVLNGYSGRREQFGAAFPCPVDPSGVDLQAQVHVSFINNLAETILGGKTITDTFFMRYAKVLHAQLPLPLMVHSRSRRWTVTMAKHRPLELVIPKPNHFQFIFRATEMELDGLKYTGPLTAKFTYSMQDNGFNEIELIRQGDVEVETAFDTESRMFLYEKVAAFFAPAFSGGGVVIPDGGTLGALRGLQSDGVKAENEWITLGINIPDDVLNQVLRLRELNAASNPSAATTTR